MAPALEAFSPQLWPLVWKRKAQPRIAPAMRPWNTIEPTKFAASLSSLSLSNVRVVAMSPSSLLDRLGDDADVGNAGLLDGIHDGGEGAEGYAFIGPQVDDPFGGIGFGGGSQERGEFVDVDGLVLQEDVLLAVNGDDHALFGELIYGACFGDCDFDA